MGSMAERQGMGFSDIPLRESECEIKLSNSKNDPFCWRHFGIITEQVSVLLINIVHLPLHRQESENVRQISYLAPASDSLFSSIPVCGVFNGNYYSSILFVCLCCYGNKEAAAAAAAPPTMTGHWMC